MSFLSSFICKSSCIITQSYERTALLATSIACRYASKKASGSSRNKRQSRGKPKHRGLKVGDGQMVPRGSILALQLGLRFHPGLNVGFGVNGTLFAMERGRVVVSCEKVDPNFNHTWIQRVYGNRDMSHVYKKYINIIQEPDHTRFKLIDSV